MPSLTRRAGLALLLAVPVGALAACAGDSGADPEPDPSEPTGAAAAIDEQAAQEVDLVALYDAVLAAFPGSAVEPLLTAVRDQHAQHCDALGGGSEPSTTTPMVPATLAAALSALAATEREASRARVRACVEAADPEAARLLALIAASEASHVPALRDARDEGSS